MRRAKIEGKRTKAEWYYDVFDKVYILARRPNGKEVYLAEMVDEDSEGMCENIETVKANGKFLCQAVNSHDALVASVKELKSCLEGWMEIADKGDEREYDADAIKNAEAVLKAAEEA